MTAAAQEQIMNEFPDDNIPPAHTNAKLVQSDPNFNNAERIMFTADSAENLLLAAGKTVNLNVKRGGRSGGSVIKKRPPTVYIKNYGAGSS